MKTAGILALLAVMAMTSVDAGILRGKRSSDYQEFEKNKNYLEGALQGKVEHLTYNQCYDKCLKAADATEDTPRAIMRVCSYVCETIGVAV